MIEVNSLHRNYGETKAVNNVSFSVGQGEIVGLLGSNGAGKTTIMKMLTGYLEPTAGRIRIGERDMQSERKTIQGQIGYLPENCPIYPDMTVIDYLDYQATLHNVLPGQRAQAIRTAIKRTDLKEKALDSVATLSRGYRQRVGVAQAILHTPRLVILDEPTNGLDPSQIQDMRSLIHSLAEHATVLISTHILQEVQATCQRVLIMRRGKLALDTRLEELGDSRRLRVTVDTPPDRATPMFESIPGITSVTELPRQGQHYTYALSTDGNGEQQAPEVAKTVTTRGQALFSLEPEKRDLETVFAEVNAREPGDASYANLV